MKKQIDEAGTDSRVLELQEKLAAAEKRIAELEVWEKFPGYLLDHCEGEVIYEESLQHWLSESIKQGQES